jgi:thioredoxin-like negative regulator of GroEL
MAGVHLASADALAHLERVEEARAQFEAEIAAFPQDGRARIGLAMLYRAQGRVREANETIAAMLQATPTPANFVVAARTLQAFGEPDTGRQVIAQGLQRFPGNRDLLAARAALFR